MSAGTSAAPARKRRHAQTPVPAPEQAAVSNHKTRTATASLSARRLQMLKAQGEPLLWLTGAGLAMCVAMIAGLLLSLKYFSSITLPPWALVNSICIGSG